MLFNHVSVVGSEGNSSYAALPDNVHITGSSVDVVANCSWDGEGYYAKSVRAAFYLNSGTTWKGSFSSIAYVPTASDKYAGSRAFTVNIPLTALNNATGEYNIEVWYEVEWSNGDTVSYSSMNVWEYVFNFYQYSAPTIPSFAVNRCLSDGTNDEDGTYVEATVQFAASSIGGNNALTLEIYRKLTADANYTLDKTINISALGYSGTAGPETLTLTYATNAAYDLKAVLTDLISTVSNVKTVQTAFKLYDFDGPNKKVALGKAAEPTGPSFDVGVGMDARFRDTVDFDVAPSIAAAEIAAFFAKVMPICILSQPTVETVTTGTNRCWFPAYQTVQRNDDDAFGILLGGSSGTRKIGFVIPADGFYRLVALVRLVDGTTTNMCMRFFQFNSSWTPPAANYVNEATPYGDANLILTRLNLANAWGTANAAGTLVVDFYGNTGDKIWPTFYVPSSNKNIDAESTYTSIQRIG